MDETTFVKNYGHLLGAQTPAQQAEEMRNREIMLTESKTTTTPRNPVDHGEFGKPKFSERKRPWIPMQLRKAQIMCGLPYDEAKERYGLWGVRILKDCIGPNGVPIFRGDTAKLTGDVAVCLVTEEQAEFDDPRQAEERDFKAMAKKLGMDAKKSIKEIAAFAQPKKKDGWMSKVVQPTPANE
jgi:hypothetical protein